jgi:hypothetical protein
MHERSTVLRRSAKTTAVWVALGAWMAALPQLFWSVIDARHGRDGVPLGPPIAGVGAGLAVAVGLAAHEEDHGFDRLEQALLLGMNLAPWMAGGSSHQPRAFRRRSPAWGTLLVPPLLTGPLLLVLRFRRDLRRRATAE